MNEAEIKQAMWAFFQSSEADQRATLLGLLKESVASVPAGVVPEAAPSAPPPRMSEPAAEPLPPGTTTSQTDLGKQFEDIASSP